MTAPLSVRVTVEDVWDEVLVELTSDTPVGDIKRRALALTGVRRDPALYVLKFRGAELSDESRTASAAGVVPNGALIVMSRRRRPVR
jgi:hypothetical protein